MKTSRTFCSVGDNIQPIECKTQFTYDSDHYLCILEYYYLQSSYFHCLNTAKETRANDLTRCTNNGN